MAQDSKFTKWAFACAAAACMLYAPEADARAMIVTSSFTDSACATPSGDAPALQEPGCVAFGLFSIELGCDNIKVFTEAGCKGTAISTAPSSGCLTLQGQAGSFKSSCENADWFKMVKPAGGSCNADNTIAVADQQVVGFFKGADTCADFTVSASPGSGKLTAVSGVATGTYTGVTSNGDRTCAAAAAPVTYTVGKCFNDTSATGDTEVGALRMILTASATGASVHVFALVMLALACFSMM